MGKPTIADLTTQMEALTVRAEGAEAKVTELEAAMGDMVDAPKPVDYPLPTVDGDADLTTNDAAEAVAAWQDVADVEVVNYPMPPVDDAEEGADLPSTTDAKAAVLAWVSLADDRAGAGEDDDRMSKEAQDALVAELTAAREQIEKGRITIEGLKSQMGSMRMAVGGEAPLTYDEVDKAIKRDHKVRFQVVQEYKFMGMHMIAGRVLCAQHYHDLLSHVRGGLRLIPAPPEA